MIVPVRQPAPKPAPERKSLDELRRLHPTICFTTAVAFSLGHELGLSKQCERCGQPIEPQATPV